MNILHFEEICVSFLKNLLETYVHFFKFYISFDFFCKFTGFMTKIFEFSFFHILTISYANITCDPIFENEFIIRIVWSILESDMTKALDVTEILRQSL